MRISVCATAVCATTLSSLAATVSPEAAPVLDRVLAWYAAAPGVSTKVVQEMAIPGVPPMKMETAVSILRPNLFQVDMTGSGGMGMPGVVVSSNGTELTEAVSDMKVWAVAAAPSSLKVDDVAALQMAGPAGFVFDLMAKGARESLLGDVESVTYAGKDGQSDLLTLTSKSDPDGFMPSIPMTVTIGPKDSAWVTKLSIKIPKEQAMPGMPEEMVILFKDWKKLQDTPETRAAIEWKAPDDWKKIDNLMDELMGGMPGIPEMEESGAEHDMLGKPAPEFTLPSLKGDDVALTSLKGKIVILDFWATWCGPCRQGLPVLMEIAKDRSRDDVVLWAIDLDETKDKVTSFLERKKWSLPVLMDAKGRVAGKYRVGGIPHTVVIDQEGVVRAVEIGFGGAEATKKKLNAVIDEILQPDG